MIDLNTLISNALVAAVQQAVAPLNERIAKLELCNAEHHQRLLVLEGALTDRVAALEDQAIVTSNRINDRIDALETKLTEAALFAQTSNVTITIDEAKMVEALNDQEWFWSKINDYVERQMDDHLQTYDHDEYDSHIGDDDKHFDGDIEDAVRDALSNMTFDVSIR